ncbi:hypothetical protein B0H17DRAFT_1139294 [Mycena rosella]|uniref:Uncharacterized protein n=1 Tax=Mycena rosella TaxID=1033263 RepID=A0AAD7G8V9_MYCRO|nr:hypothetical protein B0H17DRAFT_1139294 [Mycena rosella]
MELPVILGVAIATQGHSDTATDSINILSVKSRSVIPLAEFSAWLNSRNVINGVLARRSRTRRWNEVWLKVGMGMPAKLMVVVVNGGCGEGSELLRKAVVNLSLTMIVKSVNGLGNMGSIEEYIHSHSFL